MTKILVYGAGPLGSLFAARLQQGGNDVSILARGQRLAELCEHGIVLMDVQTGKQTITGVHVVERLAPNCQRPRSLIGLWPNSMDRPGARKEAPEGLLKPWPASIS